MAHSEGVRTMNAAKMKWTRDHKSVCGRFWCYKAPRADEWQLWDRHVKDSRGAATRTWHRHIAGAKEYAEVIAAKESA